MNQSNKNSIDTVDAVVNDILSEMTLDDKVRTANLDEDGVLVLQHLANTFDPYLISNLRK